MRVSSLMRNRIAALHWWMFDECEVAICSVKSITEMHTSLITLE